MALFKLGGISNGVKEYFKIAFKSIATRKVRSWLTTIGIVIGVFLIVSLLSLSQGLKNAVLNQLSMIGKDLIMIMPGDISNITSLVTGDELSEEDLKIIKQTEGVAKVVSIDYTSIVMRYNNQKKTVLLYSADWKNALDVFENDVGWSLAEGRWPIARKNEIIVGKKEELLNREFLVENISWTISPLKKSPTIADVRIRYRHKEAKAKIYPMKNNTAKVVFEKPQMSITPGQSAVFYKKDIVLGGGIIKEIP